jgi:tetratricopeptide (TPR) repeat protein
MVRILRFTILVGFGLVVSIAIPLGCGSSESPAGSPALKKTVEEPIKTAGSPKETAAPKSQGKEPPVESQFLPADLDARAMHRTAWYFAEVPEGDRPGPRAFVALARPVFAEFPSPGISEGILVHEVMRQALLCAARDRFGVLGRDGSLGETLPLKLPSGAWEISTIFPGRQPAHVAITKRGATGREVVWHDEHTTATGDLIDLALVVEWAETLSRDRFPELLKQAGLEGKPIPFVAEGPVPEDVEHRLSRMTCVEQFAAVRLLHEAVRDHGESLARLGALIRGYAHLGVLTEFHWNASHKAYKARALVLAQRWVAREPRSALARWHRAYARALVGMHKAALDDLAAADTLAAEGQPGAAMPPSWVPLMDALCRFNTPALTRRAADMDTDSELALLLAFLTVEEAASSIQFVKVAQAVLQDNPECYRVHDALCRPATVNTPTTEMPIEIFKVAVPRRLKGIPFLPASITGKLDGRSTEPDLVRAIIAAGNSFDDRGEPAWSVLGLMLRETRFAQLWRRLHFERFNLLTTYEETRSQAHFLLSDHPYRSFLESYSLLSRQLTGQLRILLDKLVVPDAEYKETELFDRLYVFGPERFNRLYALAGVHTDAIYRDMVELAQRGLAAAPIGATAGWILQVSPHAPPGQRMLISGDWAQAEPHAADWEKNASEHEQIDVLQALGKHYTEQKQWAVAERCLARSIQALPDQQGYELLANVYRAQGDLAKWQATLERFLQEPEFRLSHASVEVKIAYHLMLLKEWDKALPYATRAAQSKAAWAFLCLSDCYEGLEDWENAELYTIRDVRSYPSDWANWFLFCKRTGQGDLKEARELAEQAVERIGAAGNDAELSQAARYYIVIGEPKKALDLMRKAFEDSSPNLANGLELALLADELNDRALRDSTVEKVCKSPAIRKLDSFPAIEQLSRALAGGGNPPLDLAAIDAALGRIEPGAPRANMAYFIGAFLYKHDAPTQAKRYFEMCLGTPSAFLWYRTISSIRLRSTQPSATPKS